MAHDPSRARTLVPETTPTADRPDALDDAVMRRLRMGNVVVGVAHLLQGVVILLLANDFAIPVTATYQNGPPGTPAGESFTLFEVPFGPAIAAFLFLAAIDHLLVAAPRITTWYAANLRRGRNPARWLEYSVSASVMIVLIAMLTGIQSVYALLAIFGVNVAMICFGDLMERTNPDRTDVAWRPFVYGCVAGIVPWLVITVAIVGAQVEYSGVPSFVFGIFITLFLLFNSFAVNQWLQYRRVGRWRSYPFGEGSYIVLSLVAKSLLAWQVFAGALAG
jgi:hypothetical protein